MKRNIYILSALLAGAVGLTGCSDFLDKQSAAYDSDGFYRTDAGLDEGVTGAYALGYFPENTLSATDDETLAMFTEG